MPVPKKSLMSNAISPLSGRDIPGPVRRAVARVMFPRNISCWMTATMMLALVAGPISREAACLAQATLPAGPQPQDAVDVGRISQAFSVVRTWMQQPDHANDAHF